MANQTWSGDNSIQHTNQPYYRKNNPSPSIALRALDKSNSMYDDAFNKYLADDGELFGNLAYFRSGIPMKHRSYPLLQENIDQARKGAPYWMDRNTSPRADWVDKSTKPK